MRTPLLSTVFLLLGGSLPASALDVAFIAAENGVVRVEESSCASSVEAGFGLDAGGDDLVSAGVVPPGEVDPEAMACASEGGFGECEYGAEGFATVPEMRGAFPLGDYEVQLNGSSDSYAFDVSPVVATHPPDGFAADFVDVTSPTCLESTSTTPTFAWTICAGCGDADAIKFDLNDLTDDTEVIDPSIWAAPADGTYVHPAPLPTGHVYRFTIELVNCRTPPASPGDPCPVSFSTTTQGDGFALFDEFAVQTERLFVVPEPGRTEALLVLVAVLFVGGRRGTLRR